MSQPVAFLKQNYLRLGFIGFKQVLFQNSEMEVTKYFTSFLQEQVDEIDIEIMAACYDIFKGNKNAISILEGVRRKLKVIQKKGDIYKKELNNIYNYRWSRNEKTEENLKKENKLIKKEDLQYIQVF